MNSYYPGTFLTKKSNSCLIKFTVMCIYQRFINIIRDSEVKVDFEIGADGLITKKKPSVFDPKSDVPFWGEEFFPLPVPEYWPPVEVEDEVKEKKRNFIRSSGSKDKGGKLGMPMGVLEDETEVHLRVEIHDLEASANDEASDDTRLAVMSIPRPWWLMVGAYMP